MKLKSETKIPQYTLPDFAKDYEEGVIAISSGYKGGCGKSMFIKTVIEYKRYQKTGNLILVEGDRDNPDVARQYRRLVETDFAVFTENDEQQSKADGIITHACEGKFVVVNQPAQVGAAQEKWLFEDNLYELFEEENIPVIMFFVSNGMYDSNKLFFSSVKKYGDIMHTVFVANKGLHSDFSALYEDEEFKAIIDEYQIPVMELGKLGHKENNYLDTTQMAFSEGLQSDELTIVSKQRIKNFLKKAFSEFEKIGL